MAKKKHTVTNAMRILSAAGISYEAVEYEAEEITKDFGEYIARLTGLPPERSFKTLVAKGDKTGPVVAVICVDDEVDLKKLAKESGNKSVSLIHVKELQGLTGYIRGGVSPVGMKKKYPTYISDKCAGLDWMAVSGGVCGITLKLSPEGLRDITDGKICSLTN